MSTSSDSRHKRRSLTVLVPALDEEHALATTLDRILATVPRFWPSFEVLVFNDGSTDATGEIADRYARAHSQVRAFHHAKPVSLGGVFARGIEQAKCEHLIMIHGQGDITVETMERIFSAAGEADLVIPFQLNTDERPLHRRWLSRGFVSILNQAFDLKLRYYNHYVLFRRADLARVRLDTSGYAQQASILIQLIRKRGLTYLEVPVRDDFSRKRRSYALRPKNIASVARFFVTTLIDVRGGAR